MRRSALLSIAESPSPEHAVNSAAICSQRLDAEVCANRQLHGLSGGRFVGATGSTFAASRDVFPAGIEVSWAWAFKPSDCFSLPHASVSALIIITVAIPRGGGIAVPIATVDLTAARSRLLNGSRARGGFYDC